MKFLTPTRMAKSKKAPYFIYLLKYQKQNEEKSIARFGFFLELDFVLMQHFFNGNFDSPFTGKSRFQKKIQTLKFCVKMKFVSSKTIPNHQYFVFL